MRLKKGGGFILGFLLCFNFLAWLAVYDLSGPGLLTVNFFAVGQGDAIFIETAEGHQILIDGGPDSTILEKLSKEMPFWDRTIDLVILTHPDSDHLSGILDVLDRYETKNILWTGVKKETTVFLQWQEKIKKEKANVIVAKKGLKIAAGRAKIYILYPVETLEKVTCRQDCNDTSIVAKLVFGKNKILLPGDISKKSERILWSEPGDDSDLEAQVLKVGHHGSKTASSLDFLKKVQPEIAIISYGKDNRFGLPDAEALVNLQKFAKQILTTAEQGDIKIIGDGERWRVDLPK